MNRIVRQQGFTLLELLVAVTLLSLLMTAAFGSIFYASKSWKTGIAAVESNDEQQAVERILSKLIRHTNTGQYNDDINRNIHFFGDDTQLVFIATAPNYETFYTSYEYLLRYIQKTEGGELMLSYHPRNPGEQQMSVSENEPTQVLMKGLQDFRISYYGSTNRLDPTSWFDGWEEKNEEYPKIVKFEYRYLYDTVFREKSIKLRSGLQLGNALRKG
ncbi:MAG TPA: prepilin-type N-terminal cleavage/methylation domain-containing protein [Pseudomonadales bacterium]|jgi:general secretion pathway protein J|nr:prepilin-type N-terminal cleavage/methylation domain-containing protein [Pseudomonadales bacterium]